MELQSLIDSYLSEGDVRAIVDVGIDVAKNVLALHGVEDVKKSMLVRTLVRRVRLMKTTAKAPPCTISIRACSGARY